MLLWYTMLLSKRAQMQACVTWAGADWLGMLLSLQQPLIVMHPIETASSGLEQLTDLSVAAGCPDGP